MAAAERFKACTAPWYLWRRSNALRTIRHERQPPVPRDGEPMNPVAPPRNAVQLEQLAINTIRFLALDAVEKANSGHPGMPMGMADAAFILWTRFLRYQPHDPLWPDRDRFVLSAGHGSLLLYCMLHLAGYDLSLDEIKRFRQLGSK